MSLIEAIRSAGPIPPDSAATRLFSTISGRKEYTDPGEKFENFTMMLFQPIERRIEPAVLKMVDTYTAEILTESQYFERLREIFNRRNPHALIADLSQSAESGEN